MIQKFVIFAEDVEQLVWQEARIKVSKISAIFHSYSGLFKPIIYVCDVIYFFVMIVPIE